MFRERVVVTRSKEQEVLRRNKESRCKISVENFCEVSSCDTEVHSSTSFFLHCRDIIFTAYGAYLQVFKTKTIQFKQRILEILHPVIPNSILCPVTVLMTYFPLVPESSDSPVFLAPHDSGFTPVLAWHFNFFLKRCVSSIGEDPSHFSLCTFGKGGATFAFNCRAPTEFINSITKLLEEILSQNYKRQYDVRKQYNTITANMYAAFLFSQQLGHKKLLKCILGEISASASATKFVKLHDCLYEIEATQNH